MKNFKFRTNVSHSTCSRRTLLASGLAGGLAWLTPVAEILGELADANPRRRPKSIILLWLNGGPSQLETFDPHPGTNIAAGTTAIPTSVKGIHFASGLEQTAEQMQHLILLRTVVSREGDHERAMYNIRSGYRPDPALQHPSLGAVVCHQLPLGGAEIPRHVSILAGETASQGGYLGSQYDAFQLADPQAPLPDMRATVHDDRFQRRLNHLDIVERSFRRDRLRDLEEARTMHRGNMNSAVRMMSSEQLRAFDLEELPRAELEPFGPTAFGRGCLTAARLIQVGVRCVEVSLGGWDSHAANHELQDGRKQILDPAFASLIQYLNDRDLLRETIVLCGGEFGRTPTVNPAAGRDHWPHGFTIVLAGGGLPGGTMLGQTDPEGGRIAYDDGIPIADIHASVLHRLGIPHDLEIETPIGRPLKLSEGQPLPIAS